MTQTVAKVHATFAPSLQTSLLETGRLHVRETKGESILTAESPIKRQRIEIRKDGTITYEGEDEARALIIQALKGTLPTPKARYLVGIDEAGIGGESREAVVSVVAIGADVRAELIALGVRDSKSMQRAELDRLAGIIREFATATETRRVALTPGIPHSKACARAAGDALRELIEHRLSQAEIQIHVDETDVEELKLALGDLANLLGSQLTVQRGAERHVEVAAASVLASASISSLPPTPPTAKKERSHAHFAITEHRPHDRDQILGFLRRLEQSYPDIAKWIGSEERGVWSKIESGAYRVTVARIADEVAGFSITQTKEPRNAKISTFYVAPPYQNQYVGSRLLQDELYRLAAAKCRRVMVTFGHEQFATMQPFFARYGFTVDGISPQRYRDDSYEVIMGKRFVEREIGPEAFAAFVQHTLFRMVGYDIDPLDETTFLASPKQTLFAIHQLSPERQYLVRATIGPQPEAEIDTLRKDAKSRGAIPILASLYGLPAESSKDTSVLTFDAFGLETLFFPLRLHRPEDRDLIIPIQPKFAARLLPEREQTTLGPQPLGLRSDHAYYRTGTGTHGLRRGARLLFYVTGDADKRIIGYARLREILRGSGAKLHSRFGGMGAWRRDEIDEHTGGGEAMAYVFEWFREARHRLLLPEIKDVVPKFNPITVFAVTHAQGNALIERMESP